MALIVLFSIAVVVLWLSELTRRRATEGLAAARKDLITAQENHIEALRVCLELTQRQVILLKARDQ